MLEFKNDNGEHGYCKIEGSLCDILADTIMCIGMVHQAIKEKSPGSAITFRKEIETLLCRGGLMNKSVFDHFGDVEWLEERKKESHKDAISELIDELQKIIDGN